MRVVYNNPSISQFDSFFSPENTQEIKGGSLRDINFFKPKYYNRGGSFFSILSTLARKALPFLRNFVLPEAGQLTSNLIQDVNSNIPFKRSVKKNLLKSVKNIGKRVIRGGGKNRVAKKNKCLGKHRKKDIFSNDPFKYKH